MSSQIEKKRARDDLPRKKTARPSKKQKKLQQYHSDSDDDDEHDFAPVNFLHSDSDDLQNAQVDDAASSDHSGASEPLASQGPPQKKPRHGPAKNDAAEDNDDGESSDDFGSDMESDSDGDGYLDAEGNPTRKPKSKRNDPSAFAASMSRILSTKLTASKRADPVLSRSAAAHETSRQVQDAALDSKARKQLRQQKRLAMEKGRVRDVLVATNDDVAAAADRDGGEAETTAQILVTERQLRKVAQRGVVKLFNAVRAAQVKAADAERATRSEGVLSMGRREEKVTEMSRKGFLDLLASGGGKLKKGGLEEA